MSILVTGGAGFIGSHVCERLISLGHDVVCVDNFDPYYDVSKKEENIRGLNMKVYRTDIRDMVSLRKIFSKHKIKKIVHLAAKAGVRNSIKEPLLYNQVNINGTLNLLELARASKVENFVFASSSSVYGANKKVPFSEDDALHNIVSPYAATKLIGEMYCKLYSRLHSLNVTCLRFFTVYGPRGRPDMMIYKLVDGIAKGKEIDFYGDGTSRRDYTYITDIVDGVVSTLDKNFRFEVINLGDSNPIELARLVQIVENKMGKKANLRMLPMPSSDVPVTFADISKAQKLFGYKPKIKIEEGIEEFVKWYK
ncbi:MAG: SDR family NAD(P)-dependent oxidoreductase [Candidatus Woesearchaeota archaeon]